jgi:hypothetical protein
LDADSMNRRSTLSVVDGRSNRRFSRKTSISGCSVLNRMPRQAVFMPYVGFEPTALRLTAKHGGAVVSCGRTGASAASMCTRSAPVSSGCRTC